MYKNSRISGRDSNPSTLVFSSAVPSISLHFGTIQVFIPFFSAIIALGKTPLTNLSSPFRPSSPINKIPSAASGGRISMDVKIPTAIGRSSAVPVFRRLAGDRFTVIFFGGITIPMFLRATRTRSLASFTSPAAIPTISNPGRPFDTSTSTFTIKLFIPAMAEDIITLNISSPFLFSQSFIESIQAVISFS